MEEVNGAELGAVLASSGTAGVDGEVRRSEVDRSSARVPARGEERRAGEKGGEGDTAAGGLLYHVAGERGARGRRAGGRHGGTTALAPCRACCGDSDGGFPKTPPADLNPLQKGPSADFSNLN